MSGSCVFLEILLASLLVLVIFVAECAVCGTPLQNHYTAYEEYKCRDEKTNRDLYIGEVFYRRGECIRVQCLGNLQLLESRCEVPKLEGICSEIPPANEFLDYPKCCPHYQCKLFMNDSGQTEETRIHDHYGNRLSTYVTQVFRRRVENGATVDDGQPFKAEFQI